MGVDVGGGGGEVATSNGRHVEAVGVGMGDTFEDLADAEVDEGGGEEGFCVGGEGVSKLFSSVGEG